MTKTLNKISLAQITGGAKYVTDQAEDFWPLVEIVLHPALRQAHCRRRIPSVEALG